MGLALNVLPTLASPDSTDLALGYSVGRGKHGLAAGGRANSEHILRSQLGAMVRLALRRVVASALPSVGSIVNSVAESKVGRIAANRVIATVKHEDAFVWDGLPVRNSPRDTVRLVGASSNLKTAVAVAPAPFSRKWMARLWASRTINLATKTRRESVGSVLGSALSRATTLVRLVSRYIKGGAAMGTLSTCENASSHATSLGSVVRGAYGNPLPTRLAYFSRLEASQCL